MTRAPKDQGLDRLRVGRAEREAVVTALQEHYAAERLGDEELAARVHQALTATTRADLAKLVEDLPMEQRQRQQVSRGRVRSWRLTSAVTIAAGAVIAGVGVLGGAFASPPTDYQPQDTCLSTGQLTGPDAGCPDAIPEQLRIFSDLDRARGAAEQLQNLADQNPDARLEGLATRARVAAERAEVASSDSQQLVMAADDQPSKKAMADLAKTSTKAADDAQGAVDQALDRIER